MSHPLTVELSDATYAALQLRPPSGRAVSRGGPGAVLQRPGRNECERTPYRGGRKESGTGAV